MSATFPKARLPYPSSDTPGLSPPCPRTGSHWQTVGFQGTVTLLIPYQQIDNTGTDPSTDLRGVGILGLLQLHYLVTEWGLPDDQLTTILQLSQDPQQVYGSFKLLIDLPYPQNFPFAVVGLNFTSLIVTKLRSGELNGYGSLNRRRLQFGALFGIPKGDVSIPAHHTLTVFRLANVNNSFLETINGIYRGCYIAFYRDWKSTAKSIIDFQYALSSEIP